MSTPDPHAAAPRYLTAEVPAIGGRIKERPEDFLVEEQPLFELSGEGEHLYLFVQKRAMSTFEMIDAIARTTGVPRGSIGYAGLKDKQAITRQLVSIPWARGAEPPRIGLESIVVLWADRHGHKLRPGQLSGNRFSIRVRGVRPSDAVHAHRALRVLGAKGLPNRFGRQRFGFLGNNHVVGRAIVLGEDQAALDALLGPCPEHPQAQPEARRLYAGGCFGEARRAMPPHLGTERAVLRALAHGHNARRGMFTMDRAVRRYYLSAFQAAVFNAVLDQRIVDDTLDKLFEGDVALVAGTRGAFLVTPEELAKPDTSPRMASLELAPSGPIWGGHMRRAGGAIDAVEVGALASFGLTPEGIEAFARSHEGVLDGTRRALRVAVTNIDVEGGVDEHGAYIRCAFDLPKGSFATVVMDELVKPDPAQPRADQQDDEDE